ncbi:TPA: sodium ion-translocating decarboxylase subunit beta [Salmonella enterica subsp. enterica serovar Bareilly]|nr:sodium ion-translocating decarboxylase subunit beta [Salmonella enterica subsp. enterica serovar Bareilly]
MESLNALLQGMGLMHLGAGQAIMLLVSLLLLWLAIAKKFEPLLLLPIGFGGLLSNIPEAGMALTALESLLAHHDAGQLAVIAAKLNCAPDVHAIKEALALALPSVQGQMENLAVDMGYTPGVLALFYKVAIGSGVAPLVIFMGVGAMTDFGPLLANPRTLLLGAAAQFGIFATVLGALTLNYFGLISFTLPQAAAIGIIGGADGPTAIYLSGKLAPELLGAIAVAAYSYMALVPLIQPPIMRALTTETERKIRMVQLRTVSKREKILFPVVLLLLVALLLPDAAPLHIKKQMLNMEPQQLSQLLIQQSVLFESVFEGLIAIDSHHRITAINQTARRLLNLSQPESELIGYAIHHVVLPEAFFYDAPQKNKKDEIVTFNQMKVIASRMAVIIDNQPQGWVISFRNKDDINTLSLQLSQVRQYADNLRAVQHEHRNLISTIAGLLFLKRYDNALALIQQQSESHQKVLDFISHNFRDHHLAGLLIGKYYRAKELGLELIFDPSSFVEHLPSSLSHNEWISIVGNLLDNAYNATLLNREGSRQIECLINSEGNEVIIEVADQGCGIDENIRQHIFERGVTTHNNGDHGIGLWLVHSYVKQANGDIIVDNNNPFGTIFTLYIPFTREE